MNDEISILDDAGFVTITIGVALVASVAVAGYFSRGSSRDCVRSRDGDT